jgi:glycosyltransferase involved in cell wall biosynthesis
MSTGTPTFSLAYTSVRPALVPQIVKLWEERAKFKDIEWVISVDAGNDATIQAVEKLRDSTERAGKRPIKLVINEGRKNCVDGWNAAAAGTTGKVIIAVADDFVPPPNWDEELLKLQKDWIDGEYVVHVNDGFVGHIFTLAILTRKRYDRFGYLWYPGYESMFVDTEFGDVALRDGVVIEAMHLLFEHMHHANGKRPKDAADANHENDVRWKRGETLYNFRKHRGFPVDMGPKAVKDEGSPIPATRQYVAYLQVNKDDICLYETCYRLFEEGVKTFYFSVPSEYWDGRKTSQEDYASVADVAGRLNQVPGIKVNTKIFKVPMYRFPNDTRIDTETRLRNDALAWIRADGHKDIIIVDGDELWLPGTLAIVDSIVAQGHIAVSTAMVPVIGLPGWPVDKATDVAVVYIGGACQFKACRTPLAQQIVIDRPQIIHFTGTRKTMEEIIAKHRTSGHYDDPDYLFEEWIEKVLPNIHPDHVPTWSHGGVPGYHMYRKFQIWPRVRRWRPEELAAIPDSLKQFIAQN